MRSARSTTRSTAQHRIKNGQPDWQIANQADQLQAAQDTQKTYQIFLFVIACISLLVGGIGIMNIMLVSVTERTREIGIRKAIGAKKRDILTQFITESVVMSLLGALTGVVIGVLAAYLVGRFYQPTLVSIQSIFIAVGFAVATGLFFGVYPAQRAASLSRLMPCATSKQGRTLKPIIAAGNTRYARKLTCQAG